MLDSKISDKKRSACADAVLSFLEKHPESITPRALAKKIRCRYKIPEYKVLICLRDMLADGRITLKNGRLSGKGKNGFRVQLPKLPSVPEFQMASTQERDWDFFRNLVSYYIRCIQAEEGFATATWQDKIGEDFIYLNKRGNWYPKPDSPWQMFIPISDSQHNIRRLWEDGSADLLLGYPVAAIYSVQVEGITSATIMPIFCYPVEYRFSSAGIELQVMRNAPVINLKWLNHAFSSRGAKVRFLKLCGLNSSLIDESSETATGSHTLDFKELAIILSRFFPNKIKHSLDPSNIIGMPIPEPFENGIYNKAVLMTGKRSAYTKRLISELREISQATSEELDRTALKYFFTNASDLSTPLPEGKVADVFPINEAQRKAIASLLARPVTVIQGPPGTGKSQVVACAAANARLADQSVLISSYNHKAIDAVMSKLVTSDGESLAIRANSKEDPTLKYTFVKAIREMLGSSSDEQSRSKYSNLSNELNARLEERNFCCETAQAIGLCAERMGQYEDTLRHLETHLPETFCDYLSKRERHLKQSSFNSASAFAKELSSGESSLFSLFLKNPQEGFAFLRCINLLRKHSETMHLPAWFKHETKGYLDRLAEMCTRCAEYIENLNRIAIEETALEKIGKSLADVEKELERVEARISTILPEILKVDFVRRKGVPTDCDRTSLAGLRKHLLTQNGSLSAGRLASKHVQDVLYSTPVWAVTSLSIGAYLPLSPAMFDLALIDEASQSNIPSAIPILFRAKRAGIIGDPCQLNFVSTMAPETDALIMKDLKLKALSDLRFTYSDNSLYDFGVSVSVANACLLNETFRSSSDIAEYSNGLFYNGRLTVGTDHSRLRIPKGYKPGIEWTPIQGLVCPDHASGSFCDEEISAVAALLIHLIRVVQFDGTIGVVTPFRAQKNRLQDHIHEQSGLTREEIERCHLHIDTAHGFQGDERDVMILSLCSGPDMPQGSLNFLRENPNLLNVAASRARAVLHIVGNKQWAENSSIPHISALAALPKSYLSKAEPTRWHPHESPYEKYLYDCLLEVGIKTEPQFPVRSRRLDLALIDPDNPSLKLDIEIDGDCHRNPDGTRKTDDHWRDYQLRSLGWQVIRFWTRDIRNDAKECVDRVEKLWKTMHGKDHEMNEVYHERV